MTDQPTPSASKSAVATIAAIGILVIGVLFLANAIPDWCCCCGLLSSPSPETKARPQTKARTAAIAKVKATWRTSFSIDQWQTAALAGGTAVLADDFAAYWISEGGIVFAANGNAMTMSPDIPVAPRGINIVTIEAAIARRLESAP